MTYEACTEHLLLVWNNVSHYYLYMTVTKSLYTGTVSNDSSDLARKLTQYTQEKGQYQESSSGEVGHVLYLLHKILETKLAWYTATDLGVTPPLTSLLSSR